MYVPLTEAEKIDVLRFTGYGAYGWEGTYDPFALYFAPFAVPNPANPDRLTAVLAVVRAKLAELQELDAAVVSAGSRLSTESAAVWKRNPNEVRDRTALMRQRGRDLALAMGTTPGPELATGNNIALVV